MLVEESPYCSRQETWWYMIQCQSTFELKIDYIIELKDNLINTRDDNVSEEEIDIIIKDIQNFLVDREENYETN